MFCPQEKRSMYSNINLFMSGKLFCDTWCSYRHAPRQVEQTREGEGPERVE